MATRGLFTLNKGTGHEVFPVVTGLQLPLSLASRLCRCGHPFDPCGHYRAACAVSGVLGRRGFVAESAALHCTHGSPSVSSLSAALASSH